MHTLNLTQRGGFDENRCQSFLDSNKLQALWQSNDIALFNNLANRNRIYSHQCEIVLSQLSFCCRSTSRSSKHWRKLYRNYSWRDCNVQSINVPGGRRMKRRTKQRMTAIHISIPVRLLEDFDETLSFSQSRSAKISFLIDQSLHGEDAAVLEGISSRQLMAALTNRDDVDGTMKTLLLQVLTNRS